MTIHAIEGPDQEKIQTLARPEKGAFRNNSAEIILSACPAKSMDHFHDENCKKDEIAAAS
ncbi:MAG: hypothetical protein ACLQJ7_20385 [Syntrophobacteraceae bacterium]